MSRTIEATSTRDVLIQTESRTKRPAREGRLQEPEQCGHNRRFDWHGRAPDRWPVPILSV